MSQVGRVREVMCGQISVFKHRQRMWQYMFAYVGAESCDWATTNVRFVRLELKVVTQNDGDFVDVIPLYLHICRDTTMKITNKMHYTDLIIIPSQLYMFRTLFSPIIRSTWLYLQYLKVFTQVAADTSRQQLGWTLPDTVNTVKCSWWCAKTSPETCRSDLE